jgi:transposase
LLGVEPLLRAEDTRIGRIHRVDVRLGADVLAQLVADYESGASTVELQQRFGLSKGSVLSVLHNSNVKVRRQPLGEEQLVEITRLYRSGLTIREVAAELGVPKTTVQDALVRSGEPMRAAARRVHSSLLPREP